MPKLIKYSMPFLIFVSFSLWSSSETDLIDQRISELRRMQQSEQQLEANKQVESQGHFIADWPKYSEDVEKIKQIDEKNAEIERQIKELEKRKEQIDAKQHR